jgi:hypothetical protein
MPRIRDGDFLVMRSILLATCLLAATSAFAETHIFTVDNVDGYEIDRCLASGEPCGAVAAAAICRTRQYVKAVDYGHVDANEITGGVPNGAAVKACEGRACPNIVAVTCSR